MAGQTTTAATSAAESKTRVGRSKKLKEAATVEPVTAAVTAECAIAAATGGRTTAALGVECAIAAATGRAASATAASVVSATTASATAPPAEGANAATTDHNGMASLDTPDVPPLNTRRRRERRPEREVEAVPEADALPAQEKTSGRLKSFRVLTERRPFWDGLPRLKNALIQAHPDHPAIVAMLERAWIAEGPTS